MRNELGKMEMIERYLLNEMTAEEKIVFEEKLKANDSLRAEVEIQHELMGGLQRMQLKTAAAKAHFRYKLFKGGASFGLGTIVLAVATAGVMWVSGSFESGKVTTAGASETETSLQLNENGDTLWADADKYLSSQKFIINTNTDTVIETKAGIVMVIPAGCFTDETGNAVNGTIEYEVKEALDAASIIEAGLETRSGDHLLETGGMFYINARQNGKSLKIDAAKGIYTEIPASEIKPGMQLFDGIRKTDGTIDWVNPKPLEKDLTPVNISDLNFYPPGYLAEVGKLGYDNQNKKFTDSLYYSFADLFCTNTHGTNNVEDTLSRPNPAIPRSNPAIINNITESVGLSIIVTSELLMQDSASYSTSVAPPNHNCIPEMKGINPAKIKAIWNEKFQNTNISTREFEERMKNIHCSCNNAILDLYVNNTDKNLCTIDSMAARTDASFYEFAKRGDGKVKNNDPYREKLKEYYQRKTMEYTSEISTASKNYYSNNLKMDAIAESKRIMENMKNLSRENNNYIEELEKNMDNAFRQIGKERNPVPTSFNSGNGRSRKRTRVFRAVVSSSGWKNIDQYVTESTMARITLNYTDTKTGKKAVIRYEQIVAKINETDNYQRLLVYLLPDQLTSFMRMKFTNGQYEEKLNELLKYDLVCVGYKNDQPFYFLSENVSPGNYGNIVLQSISRDDLNSKLNTLKNVSASTDVASDLDYAEFQNTEEKRQVKAKATAKLRELLMPVVFPCENPASVADTSSFNVLREVEAN